jgi:hypothetical protein
MFFKDTNHSIIVRSISNTQRWLRKRHFIILSDHGTRQAGGLRCAAGYEGLASKEACSRKGLHDSSHPRYLSVCLHQSSCTPPRYHAGHSKGIAVGVSQRLLEQGVPDPPADGYVYVLRRAEPRHQRGLGLITVVNSRMGSGGEGTDPALLNQVGGEGRRPLCPG